MIMFFPSKCFNGVCYKVAALFIVLYTFSLFTTRMLFTDLAESCAKE